MKNKHEWTDNPTKAGMPMNSDVLNECLMHLKYQKKPVDFEEAGEYVVQRVSDTYSILYRRKEINGKEYLFSCTEQEVKKYEKNNKETK